MSQIWRTILHRLAALVRNIRDPKLCLFLFGRTGAGRHTARCKRYASHQAHKFTRNQTERLIDAQRSSVAVLRIIRYAMMPLAYSIAAFAILFILDELILYAHSFGWLLAAPARIATDRYQAILSAAVAGSAAILALFFATTSVVASTGYAEVTSDIRELIAQDRLNRRYLRLLAHTGGTALFALLVAVVGGPAPPLVASYIAILAAIGILAFLPLGFRTFALFDPSLLAGTPIASFLRALHNTTSDGRHWKHQATQERSNFIAERSLFLLDELFTLAISSTRPRHRTAHKIGEQALRLSAYYSYHKLTIPLNSRWYTRKAEFKKWDNSHGTLSDIYLHTGTMPPPDLVPNFDFAETRLATIANRCLQHLLDYNELDLAYMLLMTTNKTATYQAGHFAPTASMGLISTMRETLLHRLLNTAVTDEPFQHLQLIDNFCVTALAPILELSRSLTSQPLETQLSLADVILKQDARQIYNIRCPKKVIEAHENLSQQIDFELRSEGSVSLPLWFIRKNITLAYASELQEAANIAMAVLESEFATPANTLATSNHHLSAGVWLTRSIEACKKAEDAIHRIQTHYDLLTNEAGIQDPPHRFAANRH